MGLITRRTTKTHKLISSYTTGGNIIFMNITETWLTKAIAIEADIEGYNMFRYDRTDNIKGGGVAIYVYNKLKTGQIWVIGGFLVVISRSSVVIIS